MDDVLQQKKNLNKFRKQTDSSVFFSLLHSGVGVPKKIYREKKITRIEIDFRDE